MDYQKLAFAPGERGLAKILKRGKTYKTIGILSI
jgi:hypothetical protein